MCSGRAIKPARLVAALALLATVPLHAQQPPFAAIDSAFGAEIVKARLPGAALVIVRRDRVVHVRGFGKADRSGRAVGPDTPFYLGSTTKSFTALTALLLAEEGKLDLDATVQRYLPWFTLADSAAARQITVRRLLMHTSGIPGPAGEYWLDDPDTSAAAAARHVRWLARVAPVPGMPVTHLEYSNLNYTTLGLVVEAAAGMPYASYLRSRVLDPLDMRHTHTERAAAVRDGLAAGFQIWFGRPVAANMPANRGDLAAGYLMASAEDIGHYLIAQLSEGRYEGRAVIPASIIEQMHHPALRIVPDRQLAVGFTVTTLDGVTILDIAGSVPSYLSRFVLAPDSGWGVAVLTNGNGIAAEAHVMDGALNVMRALLGMPPAAVEFPVVFRLVIAAFVVLPLLQLLGAGASLRRFQRWRRAPETRPSSTRERIVRVAVPAVTNAALGLLLLVGLPAAFQTPLRIMRLFQPGLGWIVTLSGIFALAWGLCRTALAWRLTASPTALRATAEKKAAPLRL
jgi:CubicO group peptidase (beta-lactamase class C family)